MIASSTTQHCVTLSTSEAEYVAIAQGTKTALFTRAVLVFLRPRLVGRIIDLSEDNQGAIAMADNPISGGRTKHIDVRSHFTRELVKHKMIVLCVFSSHSFWTSMDVPAGVIQEEGNTGFSIHLLSAVLALIFLARRIQPFLSLVDREVEFCVLTI